MGEVILAAVSKHTVLQKRMGYQFKNRVHLDEALSHPSLSGKTDNQRLEFLGDRVLGLVIAEALCDLDPNAKEGDLAPRYNHLVRKETCAAIAEELQLGNEIKLGRSESMSGGRRKIALLGDVMEAIIAAIYLDGGFEAARQFILAQWKTKLRDVPEDAVDPKTRLQEIMQKKGDEPPTYTLTDRSGPDHAPEFTVEVISGSHKCSGMGSTKRSAETQAAKALLALLLKDKS